MRPAGIILSCADADIAIPAVRMIVRKDLFIYLLVLDFQIKKGEKTSESGREFKGELTKRDRLLKKSSSGVRQDFLTHATC